MKKLRVFLSLFIVTLMMFLLVGCKKEQNTSMVTISTNPEVSLVVDSKGVVVSVKGENDEGKTIVLNEELEGKTIEEAIEIIITNEKESGFLLSGKVGNEENQISIKVSANKEKFQAKIEGKVEDTIVEVCEELNINETITKLEAYTKEELEKLAVKYNCYLSDIEAAKMNYAELVNQVSLHHQEVKELVSVELENLYLSTKEYEWQFAEKEEVLEELDKLEEKYQEFKSTYRQIIEELKEVIVKLEETQFDLLVDPESDYQKKLNEYYDAKEALNEVKANLAAEGNYESSASQLILTGYEKTLELAKLSLDTVKTLVEKTISAAKTVVETVIKSLEELEASFPSELKPLVQEKLQMTQDQMNQQKDAFFAEFEAKYAEEIAAAKQNAEERK